MTKRALIAEPDPEEALRQAAILKDDGYEAETFTDGDLVAFIEKNPPDILILRHERPGQTGFAMVSRLKQAAPGTAVVITTSDLTPDAIEKNRRQKVHADGYLRLPVERSELVSAARAMPQVQDSAEAGAVSEDKEKGDPKRPPPLPPSGLRALSSLAKAGPRGTGGEAVLSPDDLTFVEKVFSTIQHIDADAPLQEPPPSQIGDAGDRKVALLRTELKRREREIAKLSRLWRAREDDLRQKEGRVNQKDIELEGLRLRIQELTTEIERANAALVEKEAEFGRTLGETYDQTALHQAELIQQVAGKENELNALKTKLRRAEDQANQEKKEFTERIFEWEKAYAEFEQHHWKVVEASVEEVQRLEAQVRARESDRKDVYAQLKAREHDLLTARNKTEAALTKLRATEHAHATFGEVVVARAEKLIVHERNARIEATDELQELRARLLDVEDDLARHQRLLFALDAQRRREISHMVASARAGDAEIARLLGEREIWHERAVVLEAILAEARALGEATANQLFTLEEKRRIVGEVQVKVRDEKIAELNEDLLRVSNNLSDVTERLGQSEMEHASEQARAEDLERALAETRDQLAMTEERLSRDLEATTTQRDKLADTLSRTEQMLATTKEELAEARHSRQQRELEVTAAFEKSANEIAAKNEKLVELDRSIADAKADIQNLRKTVTLRDERITELLNRVRQADEHQVALEGQVFRLTTSNTEKDAELSSREERLNALTQKLGQKETLADKLETELRKSQAAVLDRQAHVERSEANVASLQQEIARTKEEGARLQGELNQRSNELFESERKGSTLQAELQNARSDIAAGNAISEQLHAQIKSAEQRGADLRRGLEDSEAKLRAALVDNDNAAKRAEQLKAEIAHMREHAGATDRELQHTKHALGEAERDKDVLSKTSGSLQARLNEVEQERHSLEEALGQQTRENGELSASLSDATQHLQELQLREQQLEQEMIQKDGRIAAMAQVIDRAEKQSVAGQQELADAREELADVRSALDEAKSAIDERAKWLQTREQSIAELKSAVDGERGAKDGLMLQLNAKMGELQALIKERDLTKAKLEERERLLKAQGVHSAAEIEKEAQRADSTAKEAQVLRAQLDQAAAQNNALRVEAQRAVELRAAEEKARAEALKMRQFAEKAANELRATRVALEKSDATKKQAEADALRLRAELDDIRNAHKAGEQLVAQARLEGEQRIAKMNELTQQVQRLAHAREASEKGRLEAEQEVARAKLRAEQDLGRERGALADQVQKLTIELNTAKKQRADALAAAQQAKAESEQIKRLAAEKIKQAQAMARGGTLPPAPAAAASAGARPPSTELAPPTAVLQRPAPGAGAPPTMPGLAPPQGAQVTNPSYQPPPANPAATPGQDPYSQQKTVLVERPVIPSAARGEKP